MAVIIFYFMLNVFDYECAFFIIYVQILMRFIHIQSFCMLYQYPDDIDESELDEETRELIYLDRQLTRTLEQQSIFIEKLNRAYQKSEDQLNWEIRQLKAVVEKHGRLDKQLEKEAAYAQELARKEEELLMELQMEQIKNAALVIEAEESLREKIKEYQKEERQLKLVEQQVGFIQNKTKETQQKLDRVNQENRDLEANINRVSEEVKEMNKYIEECYINKKKLNNELQELRGNIRVYCRIRPFINEDEDPITQLVNENTLKLKIPKENLRSDNQQKDFSFNFEQIFDRNENQENIFNQLAQLIQSSVDGKNVCIFAYGQTGSGKTFTMQGSEEGTNRGIIPRSIELIFSEVERAKKYNWESQVSVTIQEVYLEVVKDLLSKNKSSDSVNRMEVKKAEQIYAILEQASKNRKVAQTNCNEHSSRSHLIFTIHIVSKNNEKKRQGSLNLIDLAGSERVNSSKVEGERLKETNFINKSLTFLGSVITSMAKKDPHISFRNSKLTSLLQKYMKGDSKTLMFVNISPKKSDFNQTICSLRFAQQVKQCQTIKNK